MNFVRALVEDNTPLVDVKGIAGTEVKDVPPCTFSGVIQTNSLGVQGIFYQYIH